MRAFFHPANPGYPSSVAKISFKTGLPFQAIDTLRQLRSQISATSANVGNVIHNEAIPKAFKFDAAPSAMGGIEHFFRVECHSRNSEFQSKLSQNFDAVFFSFANLIAPPIGNGRENIQKQQFARLSEIVRNINVPLFVFGVGMQERLESKDQVLPELLEFMLEVDKKAEIFGCRGNETKVFLQSIGCKNVRALGCPSLYVYPSRIQSIRPLNNLSKRRGVSAGYLDRKHFLGFQPDRMLSLSRISSSLNLSYVFQNDLFTLSELEDTPSLYDDADNRCNPEIINSYIRSFGYHLPITDYRFFRDARSWRQYASERDYFFGDRFHGGVVSLQTGRPALFIYNDVRVRELTEHFSLPSVSLANVISSDVLEIVENAFSKESIDKMQEIYHERLMEFFDVSREAGLTPLNFSTRVSNQGRDPKKNVPDIMASLLNEVLAERQVSSAVELAIMSGWSIAGIERLLNVLAKICGEDVIHGLLKYSIAQDDSSTLSEEVLFRISRTLSNCGFDRSSDLLLRHFLSRGDLLWTERVLGNLIGALLRQGNNVDAKYYLSEAVQRNCLSPKFVHSLKKRVEL